MTKLHVSTRIEEYLENIYRLEEHGVAKVKNIAEMVGVSPGTVSNTMKVLEHQNLVTHEPYKGVKLTEAGRAIAVDAIRRHRLTERLLTDFLKIDWRESHEQACGLEHAITNRLIEPLDRALGHPKTCPHGNPIPTMFGMILEEETEPLEVLDERRKSVVVKIVDERKDLLEYLDSMNLVPGAHIEVDTKAPFDGPITLKINEQRHPISRKIASLVYVRKESARG